MYIYQKTPGLIYNFLHKEIPLSSEENDSCFPFGDFVLLLEFGIFVILLLTMSSKKKI